MWVVEQVGRAAAFLNKVHNCINYIIIYIYIYILHLPRRFGRRFGLAALRVGEWRLLQRGDYSGRLRRPLNAPHSHGRHWILLLHRLLLLLLPAASPSRASVIGRCHALLRQPPEITPLLLIPARKLRIWVLSLQRRIRPTCTSPINLLSSSFRRRRRRYVRMRISGRRRPPAQQIASGCFLHFCCF